MAEHRGSLGSRRLAMMSEPLVNARALVRSSPDKGASSEVVIFSGCEKLTGQMLGSDPKMVFPKGLKD